MLPVGRNLVHLFLDPPEALFNILLCTTLACHHISTLTNLTQLDWSHVQRRIIRAGFPSLTRAYPLLSTTQPSLFSIFLTFYSQHC